MSWRGCSHTSGTQTPIRSSTNPNAVPPSATWGRGASALFAVHYKPATWGRVGAGTPPSRGGVAAFGPAGSALWGGATTPTRLPRAAQPRGASAVGGRPARAPPFFAGRASPLCGGPPRPLAARAAVLPYLLSAALSRLSPPPARRVPPSGAGRRSAPGMGALGRPPPLRCAVRGLPPRPARGFFRPHPGGFVVPGALVLCSCSQFRPAGGARGPKMQKTVRKWAKTGEKRRK